MALSIYFTKLHHRLVTYWPQCSSKYAHGVVVRIFWLGVALRFGKVNVADSFDALD